MVNQDVQESLADTAEAQGQLSGSEPGTHFAHGILNASCSEWIVLLSHSLCVVQRKMIYRSSVLGCWKQQLKFTFKMLVFYLKCISSFFRSLVISCRRKNKGK